MNKEYNVIYADPPWRYEFSKSDSRKIENQYPTMTLKEICALDVPAAKNAVLYLWTTAPKLIEGLKVMEAWGFTYKSQAVWDKEAMGMGYWWRCLRYDTRIVIKEDDIIKDVDLQYLVGKDLTKIKIYTPTGFRTINTMRSSIGGSYQIKTNLSDIYVSGDHIFPVVQNNYRCGELDVKEIIKQRAIKTKSHQANVRLQFSTTILEDGNLIELDGIKLDKEFGWLVGLYLAESSDRKNTNQFNLHLHAKEQPFYERLHSYLDRLNLYNERYKNTKVLPLKRIKGNRMIISVCSGKIKKIIHKICPGINAHNKRLSHHYILNTTKEFREGIWEGMMEGDGYMYQNKYPILSLCNKPLVEDFKFLLYTLGFSAGIKSYDLIEKREKFKTKLIHKHVLRLFTPRRSKNLSKDIIPVGIDDIVVDKKCQLYDLSVDGQHFNINEGIITHNCQHEILLVGTKGKFSPPPAELRTRSVYRVKRNKHSKKPGEIRAQITSWFPEGVRLEMFARETSPGWDVWGNELLNDVEIDLELGTELESEGLKYTEKEPKLRVLPHVPKEERCQLQEGGDPKPVRVSLPVVDPTKVKKSVEGLDTFWS